MTTGLADDIVSAYHDDPPAVVVFDPLASFGASEQAVNDNEQALITAARRIVRGLRCCVRFVHHTGKANARAATMDQYTGRGGSALADGSRMTTVLQRWEPSEETTLRPPPGCRPDGNSSITILVRAKLSYAPPNLPAIWIKRTGFTFEHFTELRLTPDEAAKARADQIETYLTSQFKRGRYWTARTLEDKREHGLSKRELKAALAELRASGRVVDIPLPKDQVQGRRRTFLCPVHCAAEVDAGCAMPREAA
jgi:RecA-family ATPase